MSTSSCAGVYNSPYHQAVKPTVYGIHLEEHLENVARGTLRQTILRYGTNTGFVAHSPGEMIGQVERLTDRRDTLVGKVSDSTSLGISPSAMHINF
jgi:hypothetical protein